MRSTFTSSSSTVVRGSPNRSRIGPLLMRARGHDHWIWILVGGVEGVEHRIDAVNDHVKVLLLPRATLCYRLEHIELVVPPVL